jgi:trehalose 6-phosphate synthase/phosphatase
MSKVIMVSNRLPVNFVKRGNELRLQQSVGGVATGLASVKEWLDAEWLGWPGVPLERVRDQTGEIERELAALGLHPVHLSLQDVEQYYYGFCNRTLWPLFHYFTHYTVYSKRLWEAYQRVNEIYCDAVVDLARPGDSIWVHDYQLMLLPNLLRERLPEARIGFFLHIPFPSSEIFRLLPWCREIMEGIMGADLVGLHTYDYARHCLSSMRRLLGHEHVLGQVNIGDRTLKVDAFPMGIDYKRFAGASDDPEVESEIGKVRKKVGDRRIILSVDRLDYTKGIPERLEAFNKFLASNPEYEDKVTLVLVAVPSRTRVEQYVLLKRQVDELVGRINGRYGSLDWMPVWYLYRPLPFKTLAALYQLADVALVTPLRDGMNLIAKEFIASKVDGKGVLVLSEMAGASNVLGESQTVNPNNRDAVVEALKNALSMPEKEQIERNRAMQKRLRRYDLKKWAGDFMDGLSRISVLREQLGAKILSGESRKSLARTYARGKKRLILLDYDGTLIDFANTPEAAKPDKELVRLLEVLTKGRKNEVVIISGRSRDTLDSWFGGLDIGLAAEHGTWVRDRGMGWEMVEPMRDDWKKEVRPFLERYVDRTPGSFIEEKGFSLVWHFRKAVPGLGTARARQLKDELLLLTANLGLVVLEGSEIVEIKSARINKGKAVLRWLTRGRWDFILAVGDDRTDEDVFAVLPESAYSIKVRLTPSQAKYNVESPDDARSLLMELEGIHELEGTPVGGELSRPAKGVP